MEHDRGLLSDIENCGIPGSKVSSVEKVHDYLFGFLVLSLMWTLMGKGWSRARAGLELHSDRIIWVWNPEIC
jgi:hypothetical protein